MTAIKIKKVLSSTTLDLPELAPFVGQCVELTIRPDADSRWPNGWFESIDGALTDDTFERTPQPELDGRPSLDPWVSARTHRAQDSIWFHVSRLLD